MPSILIIDDEEKMRFLLSVMLERGGYDVDQAADGMEGYEKIAGGGCDLVVTDIKMPRMDGLQLLRKARADGIECPFIFITAFATVDSAVEIMREGAADYITKPFEEERILLTVERTLQVSRVLRENRELKTALARVEKSDVIYESAAMETVMDLAARVAETDSAVLISGESGTGKEVLARFIHRAGPRREGRFVPVNCAAISANLVESELFGHEKGAFTGADRKAVGKFEYAGGGTLFLDEIGDLPPDAQAKLLRALQEKTIQRVGGNDEIPVDVRVICATNRDLEELVAYGRFRRDLFFRINVFPLSPPPLRERPEDIRPLAEYFLSRMNGEAGLRLSEEALRLLETYDWPGNVRELANVIERSVILARGAGRITAETLSFLRTSGTCGNALEGDFRLPESGISLEDVEKKLVRQALEASDHNQSAAARLLGLSRAKFRVLLKQVRMDD